MTCCIGRPRRTSCIKALKQLGEFFAPIGATRCSRWRDSVEKAKNLRSSGWTGICQNPLVRSIDVKNRGLSSLCIESSMRGSGKTTLLQHSLTLRKSVRNLQPPHFFLLSMIGAEYGLVECPTSPSAIIWWACWSMTFCKWGLVRIFHVGSVLYERCLTVVSVMTREGFFSSVFQQIAQFCFIRFGFFRYFGEVNL